MMLDVKRRLQGMVPRTNIGLNRSKKRRELLDMILITHQAKIEVVIKSNSDNNPQITITIPNPRVVGPKKALTNQD